VESEAPSCRAWPSAVAPQSRIGERIPSSPGINLAAKHTAMPHPAWKLTEFPLTNQSQC
jgi:hypothetical protein